MSYAKIAMIALALAITGANLAYAAGKGAMGVAPGQEFKGHDPAARLRTWEWSRGLGTRSGDEG